MGRNVFESERHFFANSNFARLNKYHYCKSLDVFPMMQATLKPDNLLVTTSDKASNRPITFLVKKSPKMGRLLLRIPSPDKVCIVFTVQSRFGQSKVHLIAFEFCQRTVISKVGFFLCRRTKFIQMYWKCKG